MFSPAANPNPTTKNLGSAPKASMEKRSSTSLLVLAGFGAVTAGAAWYGTRSRKRNCDSWYRQVENADLMPPDRSVPVVLTALYALIAWSGWRVWCAAPSSHRTAALRLWLSQLVANAKWSNLFFAQLRASKALADAVALEGTIFSYIVRAWKVDRAAAGAFIPYAAWVAFASVLSAEIARRNFLPSS
jgi:translocator protein